MISYYFPRCHAATCRKVSHMSQCTLCTKNVIVIPILYGKYCIVLNATHFTKDFLHQKHQMLKFFSLLMGSPWRNNVKQHRKLLELLLIH